MTNTCILIVNADDFGVSPMVSSAIVRAHIDGIVTSTSLMVRSPFAHDAVALWRQQPRLGLGLHLDLGEWMLRDGEWKPLYTVVDIDDPEQVRRETERQLDMFIEITGRTPTHIDSHQHIHRGEPVLTVARRLGERLDVPVRHLRFGPHYHGDFYGQDSNGAVRPGWISAEALIELIERLPAGVNEIACHPGERADSVLASTMYREERALELEALCDTRVRATIDRLGIVLRSFDGFRYDVTR